MVAWQHLDDITWVLAVLSEVYLRGLHRDPSGGLKSIMWIMHYVHFNSILLLVIQGKKMNYQDCFLVCRPQPTYKHIFFALYSFFNIIVTGYVFVVVARYGR